MNLTFEVPEIVQVCTSDISFVNRTIHHPAFCSTGSSTSMYHTCGNHSYHAATEFTFFFEFFDSVVCLFDFSLLLLQMPLLLFDL